MERFVTGTVTERPTAPPVSISIETLGRFALLSGGEEIPTSAWGSRRARQLCKRLVAARGWPVTRDQLADMLWPDESDSTPSRSAPVGAAVGRASHAGRGRYCRS